MRKYSIYFNCKKCIRPKFRYEFDVYRYVINTLLFVFQIYISINIILYYL